MRNYTQLPRYQRALAKLRRLDPSQRAILDSAFIDKEFAKSEMGRTLKGMELALTRSRDEYTRKSEDRNYASRVKEQKRSKKDVRRATLIGGANTLLSGYFGMKENERLNRLAGMIQKQTALY